MTDTVAACCAGVYELPLARTLLGDSFHPGGPALTRELARKAIAGRESLVLDLGSGLGTTAATLANEIGARVVGIEYSKRHAAAASTAAGDLSCGFVTGDAVRLPFAGEVFDVVLCECTLCTFADQTAAIAEVMRVLKPGGRLGISDMTLTGALPRELDNVMSRVLCVAGARSPEGYVSLLADAGFGAIRRNDRRGALLTMVARVENNLTLAGHLAQATAAELPVPLDDVRSTLAAVRRCVGSGSLGYSLFVGRKPRSRCS